MKAKYIKKSISEMPVPGIKKNISRTNFNSINQFPDRLQPKKHFSRKSIPLGSSRYKADKFMTHRKAQYNVGKAVIKTKTPTLESKNYVNLYSPEKRV